MTRRLLAAAALTLATLATGCVTYPSGCVRVADDSDHQPSLPPTWRFDEPSRSWWDTAPGGGFIGWGLTEDAPIWRPTLRCAETAGAEQ